MNKVLRIAYTFMFYFELGKKQVARFYQFIPDIIIILGGLKYLFDIEFSNNYMILLIIMGIFGFAILGYLLKKYRFYDIDQYIRADKDPVQQEILKAARKINK